MLFSEAARDRPQTARRNRLSEAKWAYCQLSARYLKEMSGSHGRGWTSDSMRTSLGSDARTKPGPLCHLRRKPARQGGPSCAPSRDRHGGQLLEGPRPWNYVLCAKNLLTCNFGLPSSSWFRKQLPTVSGRSE